MIFDRKRTLLVLSTFVAAAAIVGACRVHAAPMPPRFILPDELPLPDNTQELEDATVTICGDYVCIVDGEGNVLYNSGVPAGRLNASDRKLLEEGISSDDWATILRLIEDYIS